MSSSTAVLLETINFAAEKHRNQRRKDPDATPYINHPIGTALEHSNTIYILSQSLQKIKLFFLSLQGWQGF